jgi:hypothetical protein
VDAVGAHQNIDRFARSVAERRDHLRVGFAEGLDARFEPDPGVVSEGVEQQTLELPAHEVEVLAAQDATQRRVRDPEARLTFRVEEGQPLDGVVNCLELAQETKPKPDVVPRSEEVDHVARATQVGAALKDDNLVSSAT